MKKKKISKYHKKRTGFWPVTHPSKIRQEGHVPWLRPLSCGPAQLVVKAARGPPPGPCGPPHISPPPPDTEAGDTKATRSGMDDVGRSETPHFAPPQSCVAGQSQTPGEARGPAASQMDCGEPSIPQRSREHSEAPTFPAA